MYLRDVAKGIVEILNKKFEDKLGLEGEWCNMCDVILAKPCYHMLAHML